MANFDVEKINNAVGQILNPASGKTLLSEDRYVELKPTEAELVFKYKRDGISPEQKRKIEDDVIEALKDFYNPDQISLMTVSESSQDVTGSNAPAGQARAANTASPAQLQAGHGPVGATKKRVPGVKTVLAVSSGKGGVGKSTVSVNLALALKQQGKKVGLLDADIYGPSIPMLLNQRDAKPISNDAKKILPIKTNGISFISFGLFIEEGDPVIWRGPMLGGVLNQFLFDVDWGELDYLVIDLPPGTGDMQLSLIQATEVDGVVVVSTPQDVALLDSKKGLEMFRKVNTPILGMIENMSYFAPDDSDKKYYIFGEGGVEKASKQLGTEYLGGIPLEIALREGSDSGNPYMDNNNYEGRPVWNSYMEISKKLDKMLNNSTKSGAKGFFSKLFS